MELVDQSGQRARPEHWGLLLLYRKTEPGRSAPPEGKQKVRVQGHVYLMIGAAIIAFNNKLCTTRPQIKVSTQEQTVSQFFLSLLPQASAALSANS